MITQGIEEEKPQLSIKNEEEKSPWINDSMDRIFETEPPVMQELQLAKVI